MAEYYTYKSQVPLKTGEKLGFTPGRGYYAIPAPPPAKKTSVATKPEPVAGSSGPTTPPSTNNGTQTESSSTPSTSTPPTKHSTQPSKAPTQAATTPAAAEAAAKTESAEPYRPTVFKTSTKATPNSALLEVARRQGGTVAHPEAATKITKPATANTNKHPATPVKTTAPTSAKKLVQTTAPASKHPALAATPTYYTYKKDVHLNPDQTLAYTPGKGYYAEVAGSSTASQATSRGKGFAAPAGTNARSLRRADAGPPSSPASRTPPSHNNKRVKRTKPNLTLTVTKTSKPTLVGTIPLGPLGHFDVDRSATVKASWSSGKGGFQVNFNAATGAISASGDGLTLTDPGQLNTLARHWGLSGAAPVIFSKTGYSQPTMQPPAVSVTVAGKKQTVPRVDVNFSASLDYEKGEIETELSITLPVKSPQGSADVTYAITTTYHYVPPAHAIPGLTTTETLDLLIGAALVGGALSFTFKGKTFEIPLQDEIQVQEGGG